MQAKPMITAGQLYAMLFTSRIMLTLTLANEWQGISGGWDYPITILLGFLIDAAAAIPLLMLLKLYPDNNILQNAYYDAKWYGIAVTIIYEIYFIWQAGRTVGRFDIFVSSVLSPRAGNVYFVILIVLAAVYAVFMGLEGLTRAVGIFAVFLVLSLVAITIALVPQFDLHSALPIMTADKQQYAANSIKTAGFMPEIAALAVLAHRVKKKSVGKFYAWLGITAVACAGITAVPMLVLGQYSRQKMFPFYIVSTIARFGSLERVDAVTVGLWALGMFVKTSLFLMLSDICLSKLFGEKHRVWYIFIVAAIVALLGGLFSQNMQLSDNIAINIAEFTLTGIALLILPLATLIFTKAKHNYKLKQGRNAK